MPDESRMKRNPDSHDGATLFALFGVLAVALGVLGISALVLPNLFGIPAILVSMVLFGAFHYVVWGRRLTRRLGQSDPDDDQ